MNDSMWPTDWVRNGDNCVNNIVQRMQVWKVAEIQGLSVQIVVTEIPTNRQSAVGMQTSTRKTLNAVPSINYSQRKYITLNARWYVCQASVGAVVVDLCVDYGALAFTFS